MPPLAVPAPSFRREDGHLDMLTTQRYAEILASTWVRHVVVAGPMGLGERCTAAERAQLVRLWADVLGPHTVIAACWAQNETEAAHEMGVRALVMLCADDVPDLLRQLVKLPAGAIAYTNPRYSKAVLTGDIVATALERGRLDAVKLSKATLGDLRDVRSAAGPDLHLMHGSSRNIAGSVAAGADVVVSTPLSTLPTPWPTPTIADVQRTADTVQRQLDTLGDHYDRVADIARLARRSLGGPSISP